MNWLKRTLFLASFVLLAPPAFSAYELPTIWPDAAPLNLEVALDSPLSLSDAALFWPEFEPTHFRRALKDENNRIPEEFRIPPDMEDHVRFWMKVYTYYSSQTLVIYDDHHPEVIYEVMDFRDLATAKSNPVIYEILRERKIESRIAAYREAFRSLISNPDPDSMSVEMRNIVQAISVSRHPHTLAVYSDRIRGQTGQRDQVIRGIRGADRFLPAMESIFESYGIPKELTRISIVESSFNIRAVSRAGATGVWQFMLASGKEFMRVDPQGGIDERRSPLKSTVAAAKLLRRNMSIFDSWPLTVTSYNYGLRTLLRIPKADRSSNRIGSSITRCDRKFGLGYAGRNYYAEFLALLHAEKYRDLFFPSLAQSAHATARLEYRSLNSSKPARMLIKELGLSRLVFQELNPDIRDFGRKLPKGFKYAVPASTLDISGIAKKAGKLLSAKASEINDT